MFFGLRGFDLLAQTVVRRLNATTDNGYGVLYRLPQVELEITAVVRQTTYTPGAFAPWAERYLSITPELKPQTRYELAQIEVKPVAVPDLSKEYLVLFDKKTVAPFISLTSEGIIYSINGGQPPRSEVNHIHYTDTLPERTMPSLPREYSLATSEYKQAEIVASYLYEVRESLMNIITGNAEYLPKDGESMRLTLEQLRAEERRALRLFSGDTTVRYTRHHWHIVPEREDMNGRTLCHFSSERGVLPLEDISSDLSLTLSLAIEQRGDQLTEKEQKRLDKLEGIIYNVPGSGRVEIRLGEEVLTQELVPLPQVGTIQALSKRMFNVTEGATTAVYFNVITGEIESVRNE